MTETTRRPAALVTGASSGIGAATAKALAEAGCDVLVGYRSNREGAEATVAACRALGADARACGGDVAEDADCRALVAATLDHWGRLDVLIANAGMTRFAAADDLDALEAADFERIFAVNLTGVYQLVRAAREPMRKTGGSVVLVSSHAGMTGLGSSIAYAASKGALNTMTLSLARALAPEVRVNAVCPGVVETGWMAPKLEPESLAAFMTRAAEIAPLKRVSAPEDVAEAALWFALGGRAITGQLLVIDAGKHLNTVTPF